MRLWRSRAKPPEAPRRCHVAAVNAISLITGSGGGFMTRPRRSMLFVPGSNARAMEKAKTLPVDGVILDLEDAVAPDAKAAARDQIAAAVAARGFGKREVLIRVNALDSPW